MKKRVRKIFLNNRVTKPLKISNKIQSKFIQRIPVVSINGVKGFELSSYHQHSNPINIARVYSDEEQNKSETLYLYDSKNPDFLHRLQKQISTSQLYNFNWDDLSKRYLFWHSNSGPIYSNFKNASDYCNSLESKQGFYILSLYCPDPDSDYENRVCYGYVVNSLVDLFEPFRFILIAREHTSEHYSSFKSYYYKINYSNFKLYTNLNTLLKQFGGSASIQCGMYLPFEGVSSQILQAYFMLEKLCGVSDSLNINGLLGDCSYPNKLRFTSIPRPSLPESPRNYISMDTRGNIEYVFELTRYQSNPFTIIVIVPDVSDQVSFINKVLDTLYSVNNNNRACPVPYITSNMKGYDEIAVDLGVLEYNNRIYEYTVLDQFYTELSDRRFVVTNNKYRETKVPIIVLGATKTTEGIECMYYFGTVETDSVLEQSSKIDNVLSNMNIPYDQNNSFGYRSEI